MRRRAPVLGIGIEAARKVRSAIGYVHPTELEIEVLAYMRGALVRTAPAHGARANLLRVGERGIIAVAETLTDTERRWAIAHELGHFEAHAGISFLGLCSSTDMLPAYQASGREPEANAFAAELLMPEDLFAKRCDVAKVSWEPVHALAEEFDVSMTAAALRFISYTEERVAIVCAKNGKVLWSAGTKDFGTRPRRGDRIGEWTEMHSFFKKGRVSNKPQTVSASAWIEDIEDDEEHIVEHVFPAPRLGIATSLLWWKP
ncbi:putative Zn peptidase [Labilithrix luteola]|uniref:Putative Zn peptidase n=1 Tax=Labilithrix luteola TaxID=1391654 RepID=A0A0K1PV53_9BACT|nr:ImmA/IrrE family metallo-endopeptidase [Labilithrix luteola]AKU97418.1 putative Zn peptidase [Labilithrix luteola]